VTPQKELVLDAIKKHPDWPQKRLGRWLYVQHRALFETQNSAYKSVLRALGKNGKKCQPLMIPEAIEAYKLPVSRVKTYEPHVVDGENRVLVLSDIHVPYHDMAALEAALAYGDKFKPTVVVLNGDSIDFHGISNFERNPEARDIPEEIEDLRELIKHVKKRFKCPVIYKEGNHEERWTRFWQNKAIEMWGLDFTRLKYVVGDDVELVQDRRIIMLGKLPVLHGHEFKAGIGSPVNAARGLYLKAGSTAMVGHSHKTASHVATNILDKTTGCWSTGCLCELHPRWNPFPGWNHGFACVTVQADGNFHVDNRTILKGKVV
jgi:predicted phosphodiesterase